MTYPVAAVRAFNRFYTNVIGVLDEGLLGTAYSLTEARVIFELAQRGETEVADLRRALGLDAGYLSRILGRFTKEGLIARKQSGRDARRQVVRLTDRGRGEFDVLDARSAEEIHKLLARVPVDDLGRLVGAMNAIREVLNGPPRRRSLVLRELRPGDFGWVVHRHGVLYARHFGWDETFEALVARIVADYVERRHQNEECAWIAEMAGTPVGCVFCMSKEAEVAQLRLLLVEPEARGLGVGTRLVDECLSFARRAGYRQIMLWTNDVLEDARRIYERAGFELGEEEPHHSFGHDLVGQTWWRNL